MMRSMSFVYWIVPVFILGACVTTDDVSQTSSLETAPGYTGPYARPLSDMQPADDAESKAQIRIALGREYYNVIGRPDLALEEARMALQKKPGYALAYHLMGDVYTGLKQDKEAEEAFRRALNVAPGDPEFNTSYARFLCGRGRFAEAMPRFSTAAANPYYRFKTFPLAYAGECLLKNNDPVRAEVQFSKALAEDSSNSLALYGLAESAYRRGNYRSTYNLLIQYHQRFQPGAPSVWLGLRAARRLGERHTEASYAEQLRERFTNTPENALMLQGKYE